MAFHGHTVSGWFNTLPGVATTDCGIFLQSFGRPGRKRRRTDIDRYVDVTTDVDGVARFSQTFTASVAIGEFVSGTATSNVQNTSEFSRAFEAQGPTQQQPTDCGCPTENDVASSGAPGLSEWTDGEVLSFGGPSLEFEPITTAGDFASVFNLDLFGDGNVDIDGIHYVTQNVSIGSGVNSVDLFAGDVLFTTAGDESFFGGTFDIEKRDLVLFRPVAAGDYSTGKMQLVLDMDSPSLSVPVPDPDLNFNNMLGVTLVEQDVTLGGFNLYAGEILFTQDSGGNQNVYVFHVTDAGAGVTDGTADKLIDRSALGFSNQIDGLDIVERTVAVGDEILTEGSLLISLNSETTILDSDADPLNDLSVERYDIVSIQDRANRNEWGYRCQPCGHPF